MKTLKQSIQEKFNFRKKLDELSKSSNLNDFMAYKDYLDGVQKTIVSPLLTPQLEQNKKRQNVQFSHSFKHQGSGKKTNRRRVTKQKKIDAVLVDNLTEHDQNVMAFEAARKEVLKHELKAGLEAQLREKQAKQAQTQRIEHFEGQLVDPGIGSNSYRPMRNYDQRPDITLKSHIKTSEIVDEKVTDREMVQRLDAYDFLPYVF